MMLLLEKSRSPVFATVNHRPAAMPGEPPGGIKQGGTEMAKKPVLTAREAAAMIPDGATIMCGGFLACGQKSGESG